MNIEIGIESNFLRTKLYTSFFIDILILFSLPLIVAITGCLYEYFKRYKRKKL